MKDFCLRGTSINGSIRCWVADTTGLVEEARRRHDAWHVATAALGRLLTAGVFMGLNLKGDNTVTLRVDGKGPVGQLVVVANALGKVRGYVENPHVDIARKTPGKLDVGSAVGTDGFLSVVKDLELKDPYVGTVPLVSGEIGDDVVRYLLDSEQTPSALGVGVLVEPSGVVRAAGGWLVQPLPNASDESIAQLEKNLANMLPITKLLEQKFSLKDIVSQLLAGMGWQQLACHELSFCCNCNRERLADILRSLGKEELQDILAKEGKSEVVCRFCRERYEFLSPELEAMIRFLQDKE